MDYLSFQNFMYLRMHGITQELLLDVAEKCKDKRDLVDAFIKLNLLYDSIKDIYFKRDCQNYLKLIYDFESSQEKDAQGSFNYTEFSDIFSAAECCLDHDVLSEFKSEFHLPYLDDFSDLSCFATDNKETMIGWIKEKISKETDYTLITNLQGYAILVN